MNNEYDYKDDFAEENEEKKDFGKDSDKYPKGLGLFKDGSYEPDIRSIWDVYRKICNFDANIHLDERLRVCRNFYDGKQWEGIPSNGNPQPVINFIARTLNFTVSNMASDKIVTTVSPLGLAQNKDNISQVVSVLNNAFEQISEMNNLPHKIREYYLKSAIDGNGCLYTYWDPDIKTGQKVSGGVRIENVDANRIKFGNPSSKEVQTQPCIVMVRRMPTKQAKLEAFENDVETWESIKSDYDYENATDTAKNNDELTTVLSFFWRDYVTKKIWMTKVTMESYVQEPTCLDITHYPFSWLSWRSNTDNYRGTSAVEGLAQIQMIVNQMASICTTVIKKTGFPIRVIDKTKIKELTDRPNGIIKANGPVNDAITTVQGASLPPESYSAIQLFMKMSMETLGATEVAVGDTRPDNTSAILAVTRASVTPQEGVKHDGEDSIRDTFAVVFDYIVNYYGKRDVWLPLRESEKKQLDQLKAKGWMLDIPERMHYKDFNFADLKESEFDIKTNVGQSSYYNQMQAETIAEELLRLKVIRGSEFLDCLKPDSLPNIEKLRQKLEARERLEDQAQGMMQQPMMGGMPGMPSMPQPTEGANPDAGLAKGSTDAKGPTLADENKSKQIRSGGGYGDLQRKTTALGGRDPGGN